uniref:Uncharacterized protein n=1 Tax=Panagrolaimus sp. PS1159 TaxID=55785 RepID=A0AC35G104_9BILA
MGNCVGKRGNRDHRESIWSSTTLKEPYFNSSYSLLLNYKNDEEVLSTMKAIQATIESGHVDAECFVDNFATECLITLLDNENYEIQKVALNTLKVIIVQECKCHIRDTPLSPLLFDCGYFHKLTKILNENPKDFEIIQSGIESLNGIVIESAKTLQIIIDLNLIEFSAKLLKEESTPLEIKKVILEFMLTFIRFGNATQIKYFCENEIAGPLTEAACNGDVNSELALKCLNLLLKKNVKRL